MEKEDATTETGGRKDVTVSEEEAVKSLANGMKVAIGGLFLSSAPMAMVRQIIKRGLRDLTVIKPSSGLDIDLLIGCGCVKKIISSTVTGESIASTGPFYKAAAEKGQLEIWEIDEYTFAIGVEAACQVVPSMPTRIGLGTSLPEVNPALKLYQDPLTGEPMLAIPAIKPDVAVIHAAYSDKYGNVQHAGTAYADRRLARAADRTIVEVEKIIDNSVVKREPLRTTIRGADMVVRAPYGVHPFSSPEFYLEDRLFIKEYLQAANAFTKDGESRPFDDFLKKYVYEPETHADYLQRIGFRRILSLSEY